MIIRTQDYQRFREKIGEETEGGCWPWVGATNDQDYGTFRMGPRTELAHRVAYWMHWGPIPDGLVIDHECRNHWCVNPKHLEAVTQAENLRRAEWQPQTRCPRGHLFSEGGVWCSTCQRNWAPGAR